MQKLYCYVDESGQDVTSKFFVVVAVLVFAEDRMTLQDRLLTKEDAARTGRRKWNNLQHNRRLVYLRSLLDQSIGSKKVFFVRYKKQICGLVAYAVHCCTNLMRKKFLKGHKKRTTWLKLKHKTLAETRIL